MGCTASASPFKDYYLSRDRKVNNCTCDCHKPGGKSPLPLPLGGEAPSLGGVKEDSRIPLTARQLFLLGKSWRGISRNIAQTGIDMFLRYACVSVFFPVYMSVSAFVCP